MGIIGGGVGGMGTAARVQATGESSVVFEQHDQLGGCAGYYETDGFAFDVGATTLVDFKPDGVGGRFLEAIGFEPPPIEIQDAYRLWLPDRTATLYHDQIAWQRERQATFGADRAHREFFEFIDTLSASLWKLTRSPVKLPIQNLQDLVRNLKAVGFSEAYLLRYVHWTVEDALYAYNVYQDHALRRAIGMLVEDTIHATIEDAPLLNAVLGMTIRRAGLGRAVGGMKGFWDALDAHYTELGGTLKTGHTVTRITETTHGYRIETDEGVFTAGQVVSSVPVTLTARLAPGIVEDRLEGAVEMVRANEGGAVVVFLGVPDHEVTDHQITHHQVLRDYDAPLGDGNNMFISVSAPDDTESAPPGYRAVILSTHTDLDKWQGLDQDVYEERKRAIGARLVETARTVYPELGRDPVVSEVGTPRTYEAFTNRPRGAIGGYRQTVWNTNQWAIPQDIGVDGFYLAGDTTWPGLGTVACLRGSQIAATHVLTD